MKKYILILKNFVPINSQGMTDKKGKAKEENIISRGIKTITKNRKKCT